MIRKTKKGPRRLRKVPVVSRVVAVRTCYDGGLNVTAGKVYKKNVNSPWSFGITNDNGREICIRFPGSSCGFLGNVGVWGYVRVIK